MKTVSLYLRALLSQLATLTNPATDVALAAVVVKLLPWVHVSTDTLISVAAAVGLVATWLKNSLAGLPANARAMKKSAEAPKS